MRTNRLWKMLIRIFGRDKVGDWSIALNWAIQQAESQALAQERDEHRVTLQNTARSLREIRGSLLGG